MKSSPLTPTLEEARALLFATDPGQKWTLELVAAANVLMKACENSEEVSFEDMLRCLDFPGVIAEFGARCLYVRTGRDRVEWKPATADRLPFSTSKEDWMQYLRKRKLTADGQTA